MASTKQSAAARSRNTGHRAKAAPPGRASSRTTGRTRAKAPLPEPRRPLRAVFDATKGHRGDLAGLFLIAVAAVVGLGTYGDRGGPVGRAFSQGVGALVGVVRFVVPVALVVIGVLLMRGIADTEPVERLSSGRNTAGDDADSDPTRISDPNSVSPAIVVLRRTLGAVLVSLVVLGLVDLMRGHPGFNATRHELTSAGGFIGVAVGSPLRSVLAPAGSFALLVLVGLAAIVLVTGVPIARAAGATVDGMKPAGGKFREVVASLFRLDPSAMGTGGVSHDEGDVEVVDFNDRLRDARESMPVPGPMSEVVTDVSEDPTDVVPYDQDIDASRDGADVDEQLETAKAVDPVAPTRQLQIDLGPAAKAVVWKLPPMKLLNRTGAQQVDKAAIKETGQTLEHALAEHGVETRLVGMTIGPTVTRYELELGPGVKVARLTSLRKDIAYAMATPDVRILAPIPGRQAIGVEVPNARKQLVAVGDILASAEAKAARHPLEVAVGRDIAGKAVMANLATMPHVLIAGATGAGKSSCLNTLLTSILMRSTPDQVRLILVDPKRVEMGQYNGLPHLLTEVVTNPKKAANALAWAVREMERRYDLLSEVGVRDVTGYNAAYDRGDLVADLGTDRSYERLPFIIVVVDELNDLMMVAARDVEESITRIAQMARAVGIHLIIATQRPSVNVITGVIKANVPARWAFAVSSLADSRVILDQPGAEKLLGKGDMLLLGPASSIARRIQGSWVTEEEVRAVVSFWKRQAPALTFDEAVQGPEAGDAPGLGAGGVSHGAGDDDDLMVQATELVVRSQLGSTSMLQRKLRVGFARAGRIMDLLEQRGIVGPSEGSKARTVLMTVEEFEGGPGHRSGAEPTGEPRVELDPSV